MDKLKIKALYYLQAMLGANCQFREGQWEAIEAIVVRRERVLLVQRTSWGKSIIYFLATKLLREQGFGPTLLISPLLSLMRNQIAMAERIGIQARTINCSNLKDWSEIEESLRCNICDILLISPERLNNSHFVQKVLPEIAGQIGLFVVDEVHCISDWGHDFRPDYQRIKRIIQMLPPKLPVLGTTATANDRVIGDVVSQFGQNLTVLRGPLARESLRLQTIRLQNQGERLAWLVENLPKLPGSGVIYCLTVPDTERVALWLRQNGFQAEAYHAGNDRELDRPALEKAFIQNEVKILVATVALGMGFDKPDIGFVIHFQRPGSVVAYYQQVGRAGRALDRAYGILLSGTEDDDIQNYFIDSAFPNTRTMLDILTVLEQNEGLGFYEILSRVNVTPSMCEKALKLLEVDGAVGITRGHKSTYFRTPNRWVPDTVRVERVLNLRRAELAQMQTYVEHPGCLMQFLQMALDDPSPQTCGRCANCRGKGFSSEVSQELVKEAEKFLKGATITIQPRKWLPKGLLWDQKVIIPNDEKNAEGRSLCYYGDAGWGKLVQKGKYQDERFSDELINASVNLITNNWKPEITWVTAIPSRRHIHLVPDFAQRLARQLNLPYLTILERINDAPEQKTMQNSSMQARNVINTLAIIHKIPDGPVLLVDDILDSGWTLTLAGYLLRTNGSGNVYPFTLAQATGRNA